MCVIISFSATTEMQTYEILELVSLLDPGRGRYSKRIVHLAQRSDSVFS